MSPTGDEDRCPEVPPAISSERREGFSPEGER